MLLARHILRRASFTSGVLYRSGYHIFGQRKSTTVVTRSTILNASGQADDNLCYRIWAPGNRDTQTIHVVYNLSDMSIRSDDLWHRCEVTRSGSSILRSGEESCCYQDGAFDFLTSTMTTHHAGEQVSRKPERESLVPVQITNLNEAMNWRHKGTFSLWWHDDYPPTKHISAASDLVKGRCNVRIIGGARVTAQS